MTHRSRIGVSAQLVPVSDLAASEAFYADVPGCDAVIRSPDHAFVAMRRDGMTIGLQGHFGPDAVKITGETMAAQVWIDGPDALRAELEPRLASLPDGRVRPPFTQPNGVREFHVKDPDGFLMLFSEAADAGIA